MLTNSVSQFETNIPTNLPQSLQKMIFGFQKGKPGKPNPRSSNLSLPISCKKRTLGFKRVYKNKKQSTKPINQYEQKPIKSPETVILDDDLKTNYDGEKWNDFLNGLSEDDLNHEYRENKVTESNLDPPIIENLCTETIDNVHFENSIYEENNESQHLKEFDCTNYYPEEPTTTQGELTSTFLTSNDSIQYDESRLNEMKADEIEHWKTFNNIIQINTLHHSSEALEQKTTSPFKINTKKTNNFFLADESVEDDLLNSLNKKKRKNEIQNRRTFNTTSNLPEKLKKNIIYPSAKKTQIVKANNVFSIKETAQSENFLNNATSYESQNWGTSDHIMLTSDAEISNVIDTFWTNEDNECIENSLKDRNELQIFDAFEDKNYFLRKPKQKFIFPSVRLDQTENSTDMFSTKQNTGYGENSFDYEHNNETQNYKTFDNIEQTNTTESFVEECMNQTISKSYCNETLEQIQLKNNRVTKESFNTLIEKHTNRTIEELIEEIEDENDVLDNLIKHLRNANNKLVRADKVMVAMVSKWRSQVGADNPSFSISS